MSTQISNTTQSSSASFQDSNQVFEALNKLNKKVGDLFLLSKMTDAQLDKMAKDKKESGGVGESTCGFKPKQKNSEKFKVFQSGITSALKVFSNSYSVEGKSLITSFAESLKSESQDIATLHTDMVAAIGREIDAKSSILLKTNKAQSKTAADPGKPLRILKLVLEVVKADFGNFFCIESIQKELLKNPSPSTEKAISLLEGLLKSLRDTGNAEEVALDETVDLEALKDQLLNPKLKTDVAAIFRNPPTIESPEEKKD